MTIGYSEITFQNVKLNLRSVTKRKVPGTVKQKIGGRLIKHTIPARSVYDWEITARGVLFDTGTYAATTSRNILESLNDKEPHYYTDGMHQGSYIIESLDWNDNGNNPLHFEFSIKLLEFNQVS